MDLAGIEPACRRQDGLNFPVIALDGADVVGFADVFGGIGTD